jgi:hypothetical protein
LLGRTKDQIRTTEQVRAALTACKDLKLDALVIIGGKFDALVLQRDAYAILQQLLNTEAFCF